jgi:hypothetical protein
VMTRLWQCAPCGVSARSHSVCVAQNAGHGSGLAQDLSTPTSTPANAVGCSRDAQEWGTLERRGT